jgi:tetratricopeptide (TPR) repeat protein
MVAQDDILFRDKLNGILFAHGCTGLAYMRKRFLLFTIPLLGITLSTFAQIANVDTAKKKLSGIKDTVIVNNNLQLSALPDSLKPKREMAVNDSTTHTLSQKYTIDQNSFKQYLSPLTYNILKRDSDNYLPKSIEDLSKLIISSTGAILNSEPPQKTLIAVEEVKAPVFLTIDEEVAIIDAFKKLPVYVDDFNKLVLPGINDNSKNGANSTTDNSKISFFISSPQYVFNVDSLKQQIALLFNNGLIIRDTVITPIVQHQISLASINNLPIGIYRSMAVNNNPNGLLFNPVTNDELQATLIKKIWASFDAVGQDFAAVVVDTVRAAIPQKMPSNVKVLDEQISLVYNDSLRAAYYQKMADHYLTYDSISIKKTKQIYQEQAIAYTLKALHVYSRHNNANGLRICYNNLVKVYKDQNKFSQAKWFILQSNTISRQQNDVQHIISSLVELANIKIDIKDYDLAMGDLNEALTLSSQNHFSHQESMVQVSFATLYDRLNDPKKSAAALKRHDFIEDSINKATNARRLAALKLQDSTTQSKKKLYTSTGKKGLKANSAKKTISL